MSVLPGPVVNAAWLVANHQSVRIVDSRWSIPAGPMRQPYLEGHVPGAVFVDLDVDLSDPPGPRGRHPLPAPERFAETRSRCSMDLPVVVYDDRSGAVAGRLWYLLDAIGAEVAVLDGGIDAWPGELSQGEETYARADIRAVDWPEHLFVDAADVIPRIEAGTLSLDARSKERFEGRPNPIDKVLGHIPGAVSRPWESNVGQNGCFLSAGELRQQFLDMGVTEDSEVICSCGSGVTACHNLLALRLAGLGTASLYTGSWSEWTQDASRPVAAD